MSRLMLLVLFIIHGFYGFKRILSSLVPSRNPKPLLARRRRIPTHLAVIFVTDAENHDAREEEMVMEESVEQIVDWCKEIGVERLSVYEPDGVLSRNSRYASSISTANPLDIPEAAALKPSGRPLTPPPSDTDSTSRSRSPDIELNYRSSVTTVHIPYLTHDDALESEKKSHRRRRQSHLFESKSHPKILTLHILSRESSKPAVAAAARSLAVENISQKKAHETFSLPIGSLNDLLEGDTGFPSPDFVIVHPLHPSSLPLELHGFPPWQIRLSEMHYSPRRPRVVRRRDATSMALSEVDFRRALDDYSGAEMRLGK